MNNKIRIDDEHARRKSAGRAVSLGDVQIALQWGTRIRQPLGRVAVHVGHREVKRAAEQGQDISRNNGLAVVLADDCHRVVTVIRTQDRHRLKVHGRRRAMRGTR